ncbi:MAG: hypothetical protein KQ78_02269 [Candidatus Izimaplasma bacterium HR2]|nr:MAG: hypothetical protein KQ78_02269 [Candidatus Izimaplasma bacterium HR2]
MDIEKIIEMLGVEKLDESKQSEIKETLATIIETKAQEIADVKIEESVVLEKEKLVEEFETKFEDYKEDVTSKFSSFVDNILEEEMVIPDKIVKYARLGELYEDLIDQFKVRLAIDEGLLDTEVKGILKEAKDEIQNLRNEVNETTGKNLQLEKDATEMATNIFLRKKCDGLTEGQKTSIMSILEGSSKDDIEKKFNIVLESIGKESNTETETETETEINEDETNTSTTEVDKETKKKMNESGGSPMMEQWKKMIRENKFD